MENERKTIKETGGGKDVVKNKWRFGCWFVFFNNLFLLGIIAAFFIICYYLPGYIQREIIPQVSARFGVKGVSANVRRVGLTGADLGGIKLADSTGTALEIASVKIDYSIPSLVFKRILKIDKLTLSGLEVNCSYKNNKFSFKGFDLDKFVSNLKKRQSASEKKVVKSKVGKKGINIQVGEIVIEKGIVVFDYNGESFRIPFDLILMPEGGNWNRLGIAAKLYPLGELMRVSGSTDLATKQLSVKIISNFWLDKFSELQRKFAGISASGKAYVVIDADAVLKPFNINKLKAEGKLESFSLKHKKLNVTGKTLSLTSTLPVNFSVKGKGNRYKIAISDLCVKSKVSVEFKDILSEVQIDKGAINVTGNSMCSAVEVPADLRFKLASPVTFKHVFSVKLLKDGIWSSKMSGIAIKPGGLPAAKAVYGDEFISFGEIDWKVSASGSKQKSEGKFELNSKTVSTLSRRFILNAKSLLINGKFINTAVAATGKIDDISLSSEFFDVKIPAVSVKAKYRNENFDGLIAWKGASLFSDKYKLKLNGINFEFPVEWPWRGNNEKGFLKISEVFWNDLEVGKLFLESKQYGKGISFDGRFASEILPGFKLRCAGKATMGGGKEFGFKLSLPMYKIKNPFSVGLYLPALDGVLVSGGIAAGAEINYTGGKFESKGNIEVSNSDIEMTTTGLKVKGVDLKLALSDLRKLTSKPDQHLKFKTLEMGLVKINDGSVKFQLESPEVLLIEKSSFGWCGGHLYTHALRIRYGKKEYRATIYCDGIVLSRLIQEFGMADAKGKGTVIGRIPVVYDKKGISFKSGYLFSTPGKGNNIQLKNMEKLVEGIPRETAEFSQLDLSAEALKNFNYNWVKLNFTTEGENLLVNMQIDGKPSAPLPFKYDKKRGCFVRVKGQGALFQGIKLDVNTSLPLNMLLQFNNKLKSIIGGSN